jgi:hypothetical protein
MSRAIAQIPTRRVHGNVSSGYTLRVIPNVDVEIRDRITDALADVYAAETGGAPLAQPLDSGAEGELTVFLDPGPYKAVSPDGAFDDVPFDAVSYLQSGLDPTSPQTISGEWTFDEPISIDGVSSGDFLTEADLAAGLSLQTRYVKATGGSDSNDGKSWATAFATIEAASADLGAFSGVIYLSQGTHVVNATLQLGSRVYIGTTTPRLGGGYTQIRKDFDGHLFDTVGGTGGGISDVDLVDNAGHTGTAIHIESTAAIPCGYFWFERLTFGGTVGFERNVHLDGDANAIGVRSVFFRDCIFFGATSGENVIVESGVHIFFTACDIVQAPAAATQKLIARDAFTEDVFFYGKVLGNIETEAAATNGGAVGLFFDGICTGSVTLLAGAAKNVIQGHVAGGVTYTTTNANNKVAQGTWINATLENSWVFNGTLPGYKLDQNGFVHIRGAVQSGSSATANIFTLPSALRPAGNKRFIVNSNGVAAPLQVGSDGTVKLLSGGSTTAIHLDGIAPFEAGA